ncbi:biotin--[acetyl-CoA-carboxylase] ligase [Pengzhenrongella frigida]|uniref:biotin--[biotin carboxyl-carrier protein] ligase n=1 Tax=Pengzhenrongella frigida TaxID=1259133 RepID=A0A4Q5N5E0_9MICO|nr:biotin--[acetyl-CoA-carboxylase] ligase [Cellulomonas sp. HLT2-17]RYV52027.1 biotin--[acetyl-CoA-carboxylase] ligase [Cellulomonas sp. HLT2-17]
MVNRPALRSSVLRELLLAPSGPLGRVEVVERVGSTNTALAAALARDPAGWPGVGLLVADHQEGGHGRAGRDWQTPARAALTLSISIWARPPLDALGWLPLLAGLGAVYALRATAGVQAGLKWPNDLLVPQPGAVELDGWGTDRKVGGILTELVRTPAGSAVVLGIGVNVTQVADELPVPSAISLALAGAQDLDREVLLDALVEAFADLSARWTAAGGDAVAAGLADEVTAVCLTIGRRVRVALPGGTELVGLARRLGPDGALVVIDDGGVEHTVLAGDVLHVRTASE